MVEVNQHSDKQIYMSAQISQKQDKHDIYAIMKTMDPCGYYHNGFVALWQLMHLGT